MLTRLFNGVIRTVVGCLILLFGAGWFHGGRATVTYLEVPSTTFGSLPSCSGLGVYAIAEVTDSTTIVWGNTITGSGSNHVLAHCNGTNWTVAGN